MNTYDYIAKYVLPVFRAMVSKKLVEDYHLSQAEVADALGVSQPAVSNYMRGIRGHSLRFDGDPKIVKKIDEICALIGLQKTERSEILRAFTEACDYIRKSPLFPESEVI